MSRLEFDTQQKVMAAEQPKQSLGQRRGVAVKQQELVQSSPSDIGRHRAGKRDTGPNRFSGMIEHRLERRRQLRNLNLKPPPASAPTPPLPLL